MKIKGVSPGSKTKRRGDIIEYSPEEKIPLAVKDAVHAMAPEGEVFIVTDVKVKSHHSIPRSIPNPKGFANNSYMAEGTVSFQRHTLADSKLFPAQPMDFKIEFEDKLDDLGQPDLSVNVFNV